ncbi:MAG: coproporphyrinogen III oxidase, partial [Alphaproteobacteria bacterium]|nr:coproporphyrinogen III oxidase [Alphaproteobacteria bacterium]
LGRVHGLAPALDAIALARVTFPRLSFDLVYARSGQDAAAWQAELAWALTLAADHLSLYQLTLEPGTPFFARHARGDLAIPDDESSAGLYEMTQEMTRAAGLPAYEISNHARRGAESRHNLTYWQGGDYIGIGPGAHGRLTFAHGTEAIHQHRAPQGWLDRALASGHATCERTLLTGAERATELVLMGLRLNAGLDRERFHRLAGQPLETVIDGKALAMLTQEGLVTSDPANLRVTARGRLTLNAVVAALLG